MKILNNDGSVIFEAEVVTMKELVIKAVKSGANLSDVNLSGANLSDANLSGANLYNADLDGANLSDANLCNASLDGANLSDANLDGANLYNAHLCNASLDGANLYNANLDGANLYNAKNIHSFQCGNRNRVSYAVKHKTEVKFLIGCFWGNKEEAIEQIKNKYGEDSYYEKLVTIYDEMLKDK